MLELRWRTVLKPVVFSKLFILSVRDSATIGHSIILNVASWTSSHCSHMRWLLCECSNSLSSLLKSFPAAVIGITMLEPTSCESSVLMFDFLKSLNG